MWGAWLGKNFIWVQIGIAAFFVFLFFRRNLEADGKSNFRVREADRGLDFGRGDQARSTGNDRVKAPLQLSGIRIDGAPFEILGIRAMASEEEIQRAYKELIKRYHPDKIGRPGSREWQDAQGIAEALNRARTEMLARLRKRGGA